MNKGQRAVYRGFSLAMVVVLVLVAIAAPAPGQPAPAQQPAVVLDVKSAWRSYTSLRPPMVATDGAPKAITSPYPWVD